MQVERELLIIVIEQIIIRCRKGVDAFNNTRDLLVGIARITRIGPCLTLNTGIVCLLYTSDAADE